MAVDANGTTIELMALVSVGPAYQMADSPPWLGRGTYRADEWTGRTYRAVGFDKTGGVQLADPSLINADASDEFVTIIGRRVVVVHGP